METHPSVDVVAAAEEVKALLDKNKFELVDWGYDEVECYPGPSDDAYPVLKSFAKMWEEFFEHADKQTRDDGSGFPDEIAKRYESMLAKVEARVNDDEDFWAKIREVIIPLYDVPQAAIDNAPDQDARKRVEEKRAGLSKWKNRWKTVKLFYDPVGVDVQTTQLWRNKVTGDLKRGEVIRQRSLPPGFVVRVN